MSCTATARNALYSDAHGATSRAPLRATFTGTVHMGHVTSWLVISTQGPSSHLITPPNRPETPSKSLQARHITHFWRPATFSCSNRRSPYRRIQDSVAGAVQLVGAQLGAEWGSTPGTVSGFPDMLRRPWLADCTTTRAARCTPLRSILHPPGQSNREGSHTLCHYVRLALPPPHERQQCHPDPCLLETRAHPPQSKQHRSEPRGSAWLRSLGEKLEPFVFCQKRTF